MPIPALPLFKHRDTVVTPADQNQFVTQFENTMDTMSNDVIPALNLSINDMNTQYNNIYNNLPFAPDSGYSQAYIDTNIYKKTETYNKTEVDTAISNATLDINTLTDKSTPIDTDNIALQETGGLLKKLSFANLKLWILSLFNPSLTGTVSFNSTTNNISLTNIVTALGVEIGDVIQISGANDTKNNSEFTVEVITDNDNIIVNQAHANQGTSKNVATRASDTGVTVKLLAKWYNAPVGLGQGWVDVKASRTINTTYVNNINRTIKVTMVFTYTGGPSTGTLLVDSIVVDTLTQVNVPVYQYKGDVPNGGIYRYDIPGTGTQGISAELR